MKERLNLVSADINENRLELTNPGISVILSGF